LTGMNDVIESCAQQVEICHVPDIHLVQCDNGDTLVLSNRCLLPLRQLACPP
jgi:hypothetical protein